MTTYLLSVSLKEGYPDNILDYIDCPQNLVIMKFPDGKEYNGERLGHICTPQTEEYVIRQIAGSLLRTPEIYPYIEDNYDAVPLS